MANEKTPVVWDDTTKKHRPLGTGEKMGGLDASSILSSDSGNLIQTGSDGLAYLSGGSIADPRADNLLEESANGKLQVTADRIVEWLGLNPSDAEKIAEALAAKMAAELADGHTIVASSGKLKSDPTNATAAEKKRINQALADADSGLVVDNSTGKLKVDFSNMPTDKFEELLKGLKMKVPLAASMNVYVSINNSASGDDIVDGRGTSAKPFKHIQAAVNYVTSTYSLGPYDVIIRVVAGTYEEHVVLPAFDRGTGRIVIRSDSGARDVIVSPPQWSHGGVAEGFHAEGGLWDIRNVAVRRVENPTSASAYYGTCFTATGGSTVLLVRGFEATQSMPSGSFGGNDYGVRMFFIDEGATIRLVQDALASTITTEQPSGAGAAKPDVTVFDVARGGNLSISMDMLDETSRDIDCYGSFTTFLNLRQNGRVTTTGAGTRIRFVDHSASGAPYVLTGGSFVSGVGVPSANFFPGDGSGSIESASYCWYS